MARALVDDPDQVQVSDTVTDNGLLFGIKVAKDDMGQIAGKRGREANAIRTISATACTIPENA